MKRLFIVLLTLVVVAGTVTSCASNKATAVNEEPDVEIIAVEPDIPVEAVEETAEVDFGSNPTNWLSAFGSIKGLNVKGYRLRGEGPDGAKFDWVDVKSTKVALSDIRRGEWTLYAEAIGENGDVVATGTLKTFLSDSTPLGTLFLSEEVGYGDVSCVFSWTPTQVLYPSIEVYIKTEDGEFVARDKGEIKINENGEAVWTAKDVPAGTYIVRAILKDENEIVSGVAAALRVIDGKKSVGNCQFVIGKLSTIYGIDLQNSPIDTINGSIALSDNVLSFNSEQSDLVYTWFVDGDLLTSYRTQSFNVAELELKRGYYRVDCIACNATGFTSLNTMSIYIYSDGNGNYKLVSAAEADSNMGDVPVGYTEIETHEPEIFAPVQEENIATLMEKIREVMKNLSDEKTNAVIAAVQAEAKANSYNEKKTLDVLYSQLKAAEAEADEVAIEPVEETVEAVEEVEEVEETPIVAEEIPAETEYKLVIEAEAVEEPVAETIVPSED